MDAQTKRNILATIDYLLADEKEQVTAVNSLAQLRKLLGPLQTDVYRSPSGYYYFLFPELAPSNGIYTYRVKGTTFGFWLEELKQYLSE